MSLARHPVRTESSGGLNGDSADKAIVQVTPQRKRETTGYSNPLIGNVRRIWPKVGMQNIPRYIYIQVAKIYTTKRRLLSRPFD